MQSAVLDSFAILAFLFEEAGAHKVCDLLERAIQQDVPLLVAAPNWGEVRYIVERRTAGTNGKRSGTDFSGCRSR